MKRFGGGSLLLALGIVFMTSDAGTSTTIFPNTTQDTAQTKLQYEDIRRYFPETSKVLEYSFFHYWEDNGGLSQFGYPISNQLIERSSVDGKLYGVQYFERAVFEYH